MESFPTAQWQKLLAAHFSTHTFKPTYFYDSRGHAGLRDAIAQYLFRSRAIECRPDQIIIVSGAQQALSLIARVHLNAGEAIALERSML